MTTPYGFFHANTNAMQDIGEKMLQVYADLQATWDELKQGLETNLVDWSSTARDAYDDVKRIVDKDTLGMATSLNQFAKFLPQAAEDYLATDLSNAHRFIDF